MVEYSVLACLVLFSSGNLIRIRSHKEEFHLQLTVKAQEKL